MARIKMLRTDGAHPPVTRKVIEELRRPVAVVGLFSALISILMLVQPLYMMNLFDRVLTSLSIPTLVALTGITLFLLLSMGLLEVIRSRLLNRLAARFDEAINRHVFDALFRANLQQPVGGGTLGQIDQIRSFLTGQGLVGFFDIPFVPLFGLVLYLLHPLLGLITLLMTVVMVVLGLSIEWFCKKPLQQSSAASRRASFFADNSLRNAEVLAALGMVGNIRNRWQKVHETAIDSHGKAADTMATLMGTIKASNFIVQVVILGAACYLVILQEATPGVLFASSILVARIIAPVQHAMGAWRGFLGAREAFQSLEKLLSTQPEEKEYLKLPAPQGRLNVEKLMVPAPGGNAMILKGVSFRLEAGEALGIVGPSGSGKSTLARLLIGAWPPASGAVRLDDAEIHSWEFDDLGPHIGYLPQDIELFDGTVAENICRFGPRDDEAIIRAAQLVGLHEIILRLPEGYDTAIRGLRGALSGGQRQRLGLARALYGDPCLIILDEPNSNLDRAGELALVKALAELKAAGKTVILIAHNPRVLRNMDKILMLKEGKVAAFGERDAVLARLGGQPAKLLPSASDEEDEADAEETAPLETGQ